MLLILGTVLRLIFIPFPGYRADIAFWKGWGLSMADHGIIWLVQNTNFNYPPAFAYVLWLINKTYALFKNPYVINDYWVTNNILYLFLFKIITVAADLMIVWLIIKIVKTVSLRANAKQSDSMKSGERLLRSLHSLAMTRPAGIAAVLALVYFFNPATLIDGVLWGQVDQLGLLFFLTAIYFLLTDRDIWAAVIFVVGILMKFQNIIFIPLFYLYIYKKSGWRKVVNSVAVSTLVFLVIVAPFWLEKQTAILVRLLTINADWFPFYSLHAYNIWWLAAAIQHGFGLTMIDKNLILGVLNAKQVGLLFFSFAYFISCLLVWYADKEDLFPGLILASSLAVFSFFHLLTESHERYLFPLVALLLIYAVYIPVKKIKKFAILYSLFSILFFLNMYLSMFLDSSDEVPWWPFSRVHTLSMTMAIAVFQIAIFLYFLAVYVWPRIVGTTYHAVRTIMIAGGLLIIFVLIKNVPYLLHQPISLVTIAPVDYKQDYLQPVYNHTLNSDGQPFAFDRLSDNYYFYDRGIASHADSAITYRLGGNFSRLQTDYGLDTEAAAGASVYFSIWGDGRELFKSDKKGRYDNPSTVTVNISGVNELTLKIGKAGENNYGAHADWLNPVLIK